MRGGSGAKLGWLVIGGVLLLVVVVTAVVVGRGHSGSSGGAVGGAVAGTSGGTSLAQGTGAAPVAVVSFHGQYCAAAGPEGWMVVSEVPERGSFGADFRSADGRAGAGFSIFPSGWMSATSPDQSVAMSLSNMGAVPITFGPKRTLEENVYAVNFQLPQGEGFAYYEVIPVPGGAMVILRTATTQKGLWSTRGAEASGVARSLHCNVPDVPPTPDPPSLNAKSGSGEGGSGDSEYNVWLEKETYHNPQTGENYWVSPTEDWDENGPEGPGYYTKNGNDVIKLQPGYSQ